MELQGIKAIVMTDQGCTAEYGEIPLVIPLEPATVWLKATLAESTLDGLAPTVTWVRHYGFRADFSNPNMLERYHAWSLQVHEWLQERTGPLDQ